MPAPMASITVAAPVTISPPANTPFNEVFPVSVSAAIFPLEFNSSPGIVESGAGSGPGLLPLLPHQYLYYILNP